MSRICIIARQPGSAHAFTPIINALRQRGIASVQAGFADAVRAWEDEGVEAVEIASFAEWAQLSNEVLPCIVLTGTSLNAEEDALFWRWAEQNAVSSIAFVDHWSNYPQRFSSGREDGEPFDLMPDRIAVIDEIAKNGLTRVGCPAQKIVITGHPAFDRLAERYGPINQALRDRLLPDGHAFLFVFVSEPLTQVYGPDPRSNSLGYTEATVLKTLLTCLERWGRQKNQPVTLLVKPHPVESKERYLTDLVSASSAYDYLDVKIFSNSNRYELISACDAVFGMTSMLLFEAAVIGRPVFSLQFDREKACALSDNRPGIRVLTRQQEMLPALEQIASATFVDRLEQQTNVADNFIDLLTAAVNTGV